MKMKNVRKMFDLESVLSVERVCVCCVVCEKSFCFHVLPLQFSILFDLSDIHSEALNSLALESKRKWQIN